jgi:hypothetical protein
VVAVGRFVTFAASALHEKSECHQKLQAGNDGYLKPLMQSNIAGYRRR